MKKLLILFAIALIGIEANAQLDWEDVEVANFESEVTKLCKRGMVTSKAKGMTTLSSQGKMQTRAINKLKMVTAMIGGTTVLIMDQQTQSAQSGGRFSLRITFMGKKRWRWSSASEMKPYLS